jgi:hypothetical protein
MDQNRRNMIKTSATIISGTTLHTPKRIFGSDDHPDDKTDCKSGVEY